MSEPHPFDQAIALSPLGEGRWQGATHPGYANMIGPYGGITAAQALAAVLRDARCIGRPVAFTVNYAAALEDGAFEVQAVPARTNRSTQHWTVSMHQGGQLVLTATLVTALPRETWDGVEAAMPPGLPAPSQVERTHPRKVEWVKRYDMRYFEGGMPRRWQGESADSSRSLAWVRDDPPRPLDYTSLVAVADFFFPRIWLRRARIVPIGTVSLTIYFHANAQQLAETGSGWLLGQVQGQGFVHGFFDQSAHLWNEGGALLATSHQVVYYKE